MNLYIIFHCAQLFERFSALKWTWFPSDKLEERFAPESVNSLVTKIQGATVVRLATRRHRGEAVVPQRWNLRTREIKSVPAKIDDDLHLVGRRGVRHILEWVRSCHDSHFAVQPQLFDKPVNQARID